MSVQEKVTTAIEKSNGKAVTTMQTMKSGEISDLLSKYRLQIAQAIPSHLTPDRMIQMATTLISRTPALKECTVESLIGAVLQASILGFKPVAQLGECYFVPFSREITKGKWVKEVQFQIGYQGYISLSFRTELLKSIFAEVVYEKDLFEFEYGLEPRLKHIPDFDNRGKRTYAYAVAEYTNGGKVFVILPYSQIEMLRLRSPMQKSGEAPKGAWRTDYDSMAKAKAIKQLARYMPKDDTLRKAFGSDEGIIKIDAFTSDGIDEAKIEYPEKDAEIIEDTAPQEIAEAKDEKELNQILFPIEDREPYKEIIEKKCKELKLEPKEYLK